jgi:hypothetical protein
MISLEDNAGFLPQYLCTYHIFDSDFMLLKTFPLKLSQFIEHYSIIQYG